MNPFTPTLARRAGNRCEYCHAPGAIFNLSLEVEHIIPVSRNGANSPDNLALACRACNLFKANFLTGTDPVTDRTQPLFNPRRQHWNRHFRFDAAAGEIRGKTGTGRATAARLQFNTPLQLEARRQWQILGLFP